MDNSMREFTTQDLNKQVGEVTDAAAKAPVLITRHRKPRFVMMSVDHYRKLHESRDPRRARGDFNVAASDSHTSNRDS